MIYVNPFDGCMKYLRKCHFCHKEAILNYEGECEVCEIKRKIREAKNNLRAAKRPTKSPEETKGSRSR